MLKLACCMLQMAPPPTTIDRPLSYEVSAVMSHDALKSSKVQISKDSQVSPFNLGQFAAAAANCPNESANRSVTC